MLSKRKTGKRVCLLAKRIILKPDAVLHDHIATASGTAVKAPRFAVLELQSGMCWSVSFTSILFAIGTCVSHACFVPAEEAAADAKKRAKEAREWIDNWKGKQ